MGLAYLAMEKYESARDALQASLKGSSLIKCQQRYSSIDTFVALFTDEKNEEVEALLKQASIMSQMKFVPRSLPSPDVQSFLPYL